MKKMLLLMMMLVLGANGYAHEQVPDDYEGPGRDKSGLLSDKGKKDSVSGVGATDSEFDRGRDSDSQSGWDYDRGGSGDYIGAMPIFREMPELKTVAASAAGAAGIVYLVKKYGLSKLKRVGPIALLSVFASTAMADDQNAFEFDILEEEFENSLLESYDDSEEMIIIE